MNLALISTMDRPMLEQTWKTHLPTVPIPNLNLRTLRSALAYELQIKERCDISKKTAQILRGFLPDVSLVSKTPGPASGDPTNSITKRSSAKPPMLTRGTVLVRQWNGRRYQVNVTKEGFEMDGRVYASLSKIAKSITGTDWSGPRFFGLTKAPTSSPESVEQPAMAETCAIEEGV